MKRKSDDDACKGIGDTSSSSNSNFDNQIGTEFIVPDFSIACPAAAEASLLLTPLPTNLPPRDWEYPSLTEEFLAHFYDWRGDNMLTARMAAVVEGMKEVLKMEPSAKFVIFSQHSESLTAARNMLSAHRVYQT